MFETLKTNENYIELTWSFLNFVNIFIIFVLKKRFRRPHVPLSSRCLQAFRFW